MPLPQTVFPAHREFNRRPGAAVQAKDQARGIDASHAGSGWSAS